MDELERKIRIRLRDDFVHYAKKCLKIRSKSGKIQPFILNKSQEYIHERIENQKKSTGRVRAIILKGRQQGCSTYIEGRYYWRTTHSFGLRAFILTHDNDATNNLFEMAQRYHEHCPNIIRPNIQASNAKELIFSGLDSGYKLGTAGNKAVGRSSTIQLLHGSEVAYWPNASEHAKGVLQAVPNDDGTEIILESTARGTSNYFHEQWQLAESGQSDFIPIFVPWFWQEEYKKKVIDDFKLDEQEELYVDLYGLSKEQLNWRRSKINDLSVGGMDGVKAFMSEYPCTPNEAFIMSGDDAFIAPSIVQIARKSKVEPIGRLIIGIDCSTTGNDRTVIIRRRTRKVYNMQTYSKRTPTELTSIIHRIILDESPDLVVLDGSPAGGGAEIRDRLYDLGHSKDIVKSILGSNTPLDQNTYYNKRCEMWGLMKLDILDQPYELPDNDELEADLCGVIPLNDSKDRIKLEGKEQMKKRGIRSPDCADALSLTYAFPSASLVDHTQKKYHEIGKSLINSFDRIDKLRREAYK